jgi:nicotine blue oxidoreductase
VDDIVVVEGAYALELPDGVPARIARCEEWRHGPGASLRCGLASLGDDVEAAVVVLADGPQLSPEAVTRVLGAWRASGETVAASYEGARGHPLVVGRGDWDDVPDGGLHERPARLVPCDDLGPPGDVDTREDL